MKEKSPQDHAQEVINDINFGVAELREIRMKISQITDQITSSN